MNYNLIFFVNGESWDQIYNCPSFTFRPLNQVAKYYDTVPELIQEAFQKWIDEGYPTEYLHPIGLTYTKKKKQPRRIFFRVWYCPEYYYGHGSVNLEVEHGTKGQTRALDYRTTSFSLEAVLTSDLRSKEGQ